MDTKDLEAIKTEIAGIHTATYERIKAGVAPIHEEQERLAAAVVRVQNALKDLRRADLLRSAYLTRPHILSGRYAGFTPRQVALSASFQAAIASTPEAMARTKPGLTAMLEKWRANLAAAMDSTTAGFGDELVPTREASELWMDVNLDSMIASLIREVPMPTNPFDVPVELGDINFYPGTQNTSATETRLATAKRTLTAYELVGAVPWSYDLDEDAVIAMLQEVTRQITRNAAEILDDVVLNADTSVTNGINSDGATIAATDAGKGQWLLGFDGLIHAALIDNTAMANNHNAAVSDDMFNELRRLTAKYAVRPSECALVMDIATYLIAQTLTTVRTLDTFGPQATVLNGQLAAYEGIPIIASEKMLKAAADGKITDGTAGTTGRILLVNRSQWIRGSKRELLVEVVPEPLKRQHTTVISFRTALVQRATLASQTHTAIQYNITGI